MRKEDSAYSGSFFEGMTSIRSVINACETGISDRRIIRVVVDREREEARAKELGWLKYKASEMGFTIEYTDADYLGSITTGSTHGGIVAECTSRTIPSLADTKLPERGFFVMTDGIEDPYNFGYAIRSLYTCGADGIVLPPRNWMSAAGAVCRSSAGTSEMIPLYECNPADAISIFKSAGYTTVCAGIRDSVSSFDADLKKPLFLIIGGEKRGISAQVSSLADSVVRIDYGRKFNGSLSSSSATAMLAYEVMRQNKP